MIIIVYGGKKMLKVHVLDTSVVLTECGSSVSTV